MNRAVFFDRDGVINEKAADHDYIKSWGEFKLIPEVIEVMQHVEAKGYQIIIVTNQRGIGRGLMTVEDLENIHHNMRRLLAQYNIRITAIYFCPHDLHENCNCRKPKVGMLIKAQEDYDLNLQESFLVGDSLSDIQAANPLSVRSILYRSQSIGHLTNVIPNYIVANLSEIKKIIN